MNKHGTYRSSKEYAVNGRMCCSQSYLYIWAPSRYVHTLDDLEEVEQFIGPLNRVSRVQVACAQSNETTPTTSRPCRCWAYNKQNDCLTASQSPKKA